ncbi:putative methyltransferase-domain-containing protein [Mycena rosella]|uniref:Methyltransferase-domain-containing protein n=1 Tax=Mycena rosella TaxID=1033263 RepID=A0AAD7E1J7_MYCRO|nr:putative methyltransferase-domain-containing protein [Mycena rosella]
MDEINPPSLRLPPLRGLTTLTLPVLLDCIDYLRMLYTPAVRGSRIRRRIRDSQTISQPTLPPPVVPDPAHIESLRSDKFERAYAMRWLTYLINNAERLQGDPQDAETVIKRACSLLANSGGTSGAGVVDRVFDFPSAHGHISITLRDIPLDNSDFSSVGAQTWGGACVLAEILAAEPMDFALLGDAAPLRVLELGSGTGLVGLALAKIAESSGIEVAVACSDFYPDVLQNLTANIAANFPAQSRLITSHFLDWSSFSHENPQPPLPPFDQPFDVIVGADIVYEPEHAAWIHSCVVELLNRTRASQFHLVIPLRPTHALESSSVEATFRRRSEDSAAPALTIVSKETIICDVEGSANEEVEYSYYRIRWEFPT